MLTQLATVARRTGYPVVEVSGWKTRGRPGGMEDIRTITCHHTANGGADGNYPSLPVIRDGRPGLPGPLAQIGLGVDGTVYVIAAGKCNHAGESKSVDYTNPHAIGIEAEAEGVPGDNQDWPPRQMESYARLCRALMAEFNLGLADVLGHKETAAPDGRKSDPSFPMPQFRTRVAAVNLSTPPKELEEMAIDNADADLIWNSKNELLLKQSPAGALKTTLDRVDADNLSARARDGVELAGNDSSNPFTVRLTRLESKVDQILAALAALAAPPQ